jgi:hypothetical protein
MEKNTSNLDTLVKWCTVLGFFATAAGLIYTIKDHNDKVIPSQNNFQITEKQTIPTKSNGITHKIINKSSQNLNTKNKINTSKISKWAEQPVVINNSTTTEATLDKEAIDAGLKDKFMFIFNITTITMLLICFAFGFGAIFIKDNIKHGKNAIKSLLFGMFLMFINLLTHEYFFKPIKTPTFKYAVARYKFANGVATEDSYLDLGIGLKNAGKKSEAISALTTYLKLTESNSGTSERFEARKNLYALGLPDAEQPK